MKLGIYFHCFPIKQLHGIKFIFTQYDVNTLRKLTFSKFNVWGAYMYT